MLSSSQKATILTKVGIAIPRFPARRLPVQERYLREGVHVPREELEADVEQRAAAEVWTRSIEKLFASYTAARAAESLRAADHAQSLAYLRELNALAGAPELKGRDSTR